MNEVGFCPVVGGVLSSGVLSSGVLSCGVLSVWGFVSMGFRPHTNLHILQYALFFPVALRKGFIAFYIRMR